MVKLEEMSGVLQGIVRRKREVEVPALYSSGSLIVYRNMAEQAPSARDLYGALNKPGMGLFAEIKFKSPSKGRIREGSEAIAVEIGKLYREEGACAISILTDKKDFAGDITYMEAVRNEVDLPCMRKDFAVDPVDIYWARAHGADAILLIAEILDVSELRDFRQLAKELGMYSLVESHNLPELMKAIASGAEIYGINNRDLRTFEVDRNTTLRLLPEVPKGYPVVTESGILTYEHAQELTVPGVSAMLVGEGIMSAEKNPTYEDMRNTIQVLQGRKTA